MSGGSIVELTGGCIVFYFHSVWKADGLVVVGQRGKVKRSEQGVGLMVPGFGQDSSSWS